MENNPGNHELRSAHDHSLFPVLSTGEIPQEKPAWDQLRNSFNRIHGCKSTGWALVSSYRFNSCHIPWKDTMLRSIPHESQTDRVGLSQIPQNLMNLPGYISELTELNAEWLQSPFQTPHPSCAQLSCGIFNEVSLFISSSPGAGCLLEAVTIHHQL